MKDLYQLAEMFVPKPKKKGKPTDFYTDKQLNFSYTQIEGLSQAFMYRTYVKSRSIAQNKYITDIINNELSKYPYNKKRRVTVRINFHKCV